MALKFQHILIAVLVPVAVGGAWSYMQKQKSSDEALPPSLTFVAQTPGPVGQDDVGTVEEVPKSASVVQGAETAYRYTHKEPVFSFQYPKGFSVGSFKDETGQTVLVQDAKNGGAGSFQIYISPLEEPLTVTKARIMQDVPGTVIQKEQEVKVGDTQGLAFTSKNDAGVETREVWFARGPWLYQVSGLVGAEGSISSVVRSWKFD